MRSGATESESVAARAFMNAVPQAMIAVGSDGRILLSNHLAESLFGYGPGDLAGQPIEQLIPERHRQSHADHVRAYLAAPVSRPMGGGLKFVGLHAGGHELTIDVTLGPAPELGDAVALAVIHDATAREAAELKSRRDDQLIAALVNGILDYAVFMLDLEGRVLTWNPGGQTIKGYAPDEIVGRNFSVFFTPEDRAEGTPARLLDIARRTGRYEAEAWRVRKSGDRFLAQVTLDAVRDATGAVTGFAKITRDITVRRRQEDLARQAAQTALELEFQRNLAEANERSARSHQRTAETLQAVIDASPRGLCVIDKVGVFDVWNPACERIFGYPASEMVGRSYAEMIPKFLVDGDPDLGPTWPPRNPGQAEEREVRRRRRDGTIATVSISYAPMHMPGEESAGSAFVITDLTERRRMEAQLHQAQKMETVGQLTGGLAHDFNNLLSIIICNLEFILEDADHVSDIRECSQAALDASLRGAELIRRMLAFARKQPLERRVVRVDVLVREMFLLLERSLGANIDIALKVGVDLWPILSDPVQIQTALANLATNARDAMPEGGRLTVEIANAVLDEACVTAFPDMPAGDYVMISVSDTGKGMTSDTAHRAFDPFFTTKREGHGTGLGLSMVFGFVKQSAGDIRIYSELGHGTTIKIYLPRASNLAVPQPEPEARPQGTRSATVLLVEDNPNLARSVGAMLRHAGFPTLVASNAAAALVVLDDRPDVDLLFTDIILGNGPNGLALAKAAIARRPSLKVLFTSGFAETALTANGKMVVADRLLSKPYRRQDLLAKIAAILGEV